MMTCSIPALTASSTAYWMTGLSTSGSISLGCAFVAGRKRVPPPAAGKTALRTRIAMPDQAARKRDAEILECLDRGQESREEQAEPGDEAKVEGAHLTEPRETGAHRGDGPAEGDEDRRRDAAMQAAAHEGAHRPRERGHEIHRKGHERDGQI